MRTFVAAAEQSRDESLKLADVDACSDLHSLLWRVGLHVCVGNFVAETVVKSLTHDLHAEADL